jgi:hypothetical protein
MRTVQIKAVQWRTDDLEFIFSISSSIYMSSHHVLCFFKTDYYSRNVWIQKLFILEKTTPKILSNFYILEIGHRTSTKWNSSFVVAKICVRKTQRMQEIPCQGKTYFSLRIPRPITGKKADSYLDNHPKHRVHLLENGKLQTTSTFFCMGRVSKLYYSRYVLKGLWCLTVI